MKNLLAVLMAIAAVAMIYMMFMNNSFAWDSIRDPNPRTYDTQPRQYNTNPDYYKAPQQNAPQWSTSQWGTSQYIPRDKSFCTTSQIGQTTFTNCW